MGPSVDAMSTAMGNVNEAQNTPRLRLQARGFNPFGAERPLQTFGPSSPPMAGAPVTPIPFA